MAWDDKTPAPVTRERLLHLSPDRVYAELKEYADHQAKSFFGNDDKLEEALLLRNDPLISLGLAQYGGSTKVATVLYKRGSATTGNQSFNQALRLAVLSNPLLPKQLMGRNAFGVLEDDEVLNFLLADDAKDELAVILRNPGAKKLLDKLFNQEKPFDAIPEDKYVRAVAWSHTNPAINEDDSDEHGPDLDAWGVQKGIRRLLTTLPVTEHGLRTAYWLLMSIDPHHAGSFDDGPAAVFKRWEPLELTEKFNKYHEGECADLDMKEEFLCLVVSMYGWYASVTDDKLSKIVYIGSADSPDRLLRCAHYSRAKMTPAQMQQGHDKDSDAFTLAALFNDQLFWNQETRAKLEDLIRGRLIQRYRRRCEQIKNRTPSFDVRPVSETGVQLLEDEIEHPTEDQKRLERLEAMLAANATQLKSISKTLIWVLVLVVVAVVLVWRPGF